MPWRVVVYARSRKRSSPMRKIVIEAEIFFDKDGATRMRLMTGFGDPNLVVATDKFQYLDAEKP